MKLIETIVRQWIISNKQTNYFKNIFSEMITHLNNCNLENELKIRKMNKMYKMIHDLNSLQTLPLCVRQYGFIWLHARWRRRVLENGFVSIEKTLEHLDKPITSSNNKYE